VHLQRKLTGHAGGGCGDYEVIGVDTNDKEVVVILPLVETVV
jgi:hypothetical protein